jgi:hypothetical protein
MKDMMVLGKFLISTEFLKRRLQKIASRFDRHVEGKQEKQLTRPPFSLIKSQFFPHCNMSNWMKKDCFIQMKPEWCIFIHFENKMVSENLGLNLRPTAKQKEYNRNANSCKLITSFCRC